jgi:hypothetical protein
MASKYKRGKVVSWTLAHAVVVAVVVVVGGNDSSRSLHHRKTRMGRFLITQVTLNNLIISNN